jgi:hypothetical protein
MFSISCRDREIMEIKVTGSANGKTALKLIGDVATAPGVVIDGGGWMPAARPAGTGSPVDWRGHRVAAVALPATRGKTTLPPSGRGRWS